MKRQIEKLPDGGMRYFTPELYVRFNSADEKEADRAEKDWEEALRRYQEHLAGLPLELSQQTGELARVCLHDAVIVAVDEKFQPFGPLHLLPTSLPGPFPIWSALAIVSTRQADKVVSLIYLLWDRLRKFEPMKNWPFSKEQRHWLYDEIDVARDRSAFVHRVLFSDGQVLEIPFVSVMIHTLELQPTTGESRSD